MQYCKLVSDLDHNHNHNPDPNSNSNPNTAHTNNLFTFLIFLEHKISLIMFTNLTLTLHLYFCPQIFKYFLTPCTCTQIIIFYFGTLHSNVAIQRVEKYHTEFWSHKTMNRTLLLLAPFISNNRAFFIWFFPFQKISFS